MELQAVLEAVQALPGRLLVRSDSTYVVNCFNEKWYEGWIAKGWKTTSRKPVANQDLWEPLIGLYRQRADELTFEWVKGHSGNEMNDLVDQLAVAAATAQKEALGSSVASAPPGPEVPWPVDRAVAVTGSAELDDDQWAELERAIDGLDPASDILVSGLRRGPELVAAERAIELGVALGVVLPYPDPAVRWSARDLARFRGGVDAAAWVVTLEGNPARPSDAVAARDRWIWDAVVGAIVVGDPQLVEQLEAAGLGVLSD